MISREFKSAVVNNNLLRTRIMLKDSFVVDPTFSQLKEMLAYAKQMMPELLVPFDGDILEADSTKWDQEVMNMELAQLVNNFSETRIAHLQKVVSKVMEAEIQKAKAQRSQTQPSYRRPQQTPTTARTQYGSSPLPGHSTISPTTSEELKKKALQQVMTEGTKISKILQKVKDTKKWESSQINELEKAAKQLLQATKTYKANRQK